MIHTPPEQKFIIPANLHFTDALAKIILENQKNTLPDLSNICIVLPNAQATLQMRQSLVNISQQALIGGFIGDLPQWLNENIIPSDTSVKHIPSAARQLLLLEALKQYPELFSTENHWQICDSLLELFDELSLSQHQWLNEGIPLWIEKLQNAYQTSIDINHLNQEARIIQTLWQAWQQQLNAMHLQDDTGRLKQRLLTDIPTDNKNKTFYIIGFDQLTPLEQAWCEQLSKTAQVIYIIQNNIPDSDENNKSNNDLNLLDKIYSQSSAFYERVKKSQSRANASFLDNIKLYDAQSAEQETQAVDLKVRMSLLQGKTNIVVVTENRKLARRLRALLERANINIQDTAGWALATTSAASVLERWLECIEQDFAYQPFLDLLKSPFFSAPDNFTEHLKQVYRLEQDIILHENIAGNLQRYKAGVRNRSERLNLANTSAAENLISLLDKIEAASASLSALFQSKKPATADIWINLFIESINELGLYQQLSTDIAGQRVQEELKKLAHAPCAASPKMSWLDLRSWIGSTLEREQFKPQSQISAVKIMNMQQAQYCQFDTLIIAGANMTSFPGAPSQHPFFNQSVRQVLQLKNWQQTKHNSFELFQQLLMSANDILITWQAEKNGEWMPASPWVSSLENFSKYSFNHSLRDDYLDVLLTKLSPITRHEKHLLEHISITARAQPEVDAELVPAVFSASRHQRLIDCPYKFFAADVLKLKPLEQISQELLKSEYGEKVHLILYAFHQQYPGLPAPFLPPLTAKNRSQALTHIQNLSEQVFNSQTEDSVQHRGWLERWTNTAESYIDWQIQRQCDWNIYKLEAKAEQPLNSTITLEGRLDRVDKQDNALSIIDYKTGTPARQQDIDLAENIQLTSYAALMEDVIQVIYLKLDKGETRQAGTLESDDLINLKQDVLNRLETTVADIKSSHPLPSWGDSQACGYCDMSGLCRKQMWEINNQ